MKLLCCLLLLGCVDVIFTHSTQNNVKVELLSSKSEVFKKYPEARAIKFDKSKNAKVQIRYTLGERVSGDGLVDEDQDSASWSSPQDVELTLQYPRTGEGAILTFLEVLVTQDTDQGEGYVVSGGIGQRNIVIVIVAYNTRNFSFNSKFYGIQM